MVSAETLARLGLQPNRLVETIVATYTAEGLPHAAPMGLRLREDLKAEIKPYLQTKTYQNLKAWKAYTANFTLNPLTFFQATFKGEPEAGKLPRDFFLKASKVRAPRLKCADGWLEVEVVEVVEEAGRALFTGEIVAVGVARRQPKAFCRADFAAVESLIHATRVLEAAEERKAEDLLRLIASYQSLVRRVAPNSEAEKVMVGLASILERKGFKVEAFEPYF